MNKTRKSFEEYKQGIWQPKSYSQSCKSSMTITEYLVICIISLWHWCVLSRFNFDKSTRDKQENRNLLCFNKSTARSGQLAHIVANIRMTITKVPVLIRGGLTISWKQQWKPFRTHSAQYPTHITDHNFRLKESQIHYEIMNKLKKTTGWRSLNRPGGPMYHNGLVKTRTWPITSDRYHL